MAEKTIRVRMLTGAVDAIRGVMDPNMVYDLPAKQGAAFIRARQAERADKAPVARNSPASI